MGLYKFEYDLLPDRKEIDRLTDEINEAIEAEKIDFYIKEKADRIFNMAFESSLKYARYISNLEERLEDPDPEIKEKRDGFTRLIEYLRERYSSITEDIRDFQEQQREYDLTNAPTE